MSVYLKWGVIHPRTLLADLGPGDETYRKEIAWREFYGHVLHHWPESAREYFLPQFKKMDYARPDSKAFEAWTKRRDRLSRSSTPACGSCSRRAGCTTGVRMIVASFLVKDLHIEWTHGARHFMHHLVDGDLASNQHGWQWTAGTGTDAAPFYRVFNPVTQGQKFDPDGDYVRRWVPELRDVAGQGRARAVGARRVPEGLPERIVDHKHERQVALERYNATRG